MHYWPAKANKALRLTAALGLAAGCASDSPRAGLDISALEASLSGRTCSVRVEMDISLTRAVDEALHNGVPIRILVETRVREPRGWLWARTLAAETRGFTLSYHSLSSQYLVRSPDAEGVRAYPSREVALSVLESPEASRLELPDSPPDTGLAAEARVRLDLQALPAPLRLVAYFSPDWRIGSRWHRQPVPGATGGAGP